MKKIGYACLFGTLCLAFTQHVTGQQKHTAAEMVCNTKYTKYYANQTNMELFDDFVNDATCKDSIYREAAYQLMMQRLIKATKWKDALDLTARFEKDIPRASKNAKIWFYRLSLEAAASLNDAERISEYRQKVLAIDPENAYGVNLTP
jgi:hypothetical protein